MMHMLVLKKVCSSGIFMFCSSCGIVLCTLQLLEDRESTTCQSVVGTGDRTSDAFCDRHLLQDDMNFVSPKFTTNQQWHIDCEEERSQSVYTMCG